MLPSALSPLLNRLLASPSPGPDRCMYGIRRPLLACRTLMCDGEYDPGLKTARLETGVRPGPRRRGRLCHRRTVPRARPCVARTKERRTPESRTFSSCADHDWHCARGPDLSSCRSRRAGIRGLWPCLSTPFESGLASGPSTSRIRRLAHLAGITTRLDTEVSRRPQCPQRQRPTQTSLARAPSSALLGNVLPGCVR